MTYRSELTRSMAWLGGLDNTVFLGQAVAYPGTGMYGTLEGVPMSKRIELPVMEDAQLGMAIGLSLNGFLPICIYPRINFLLLAVNQLVNHLEKLPQFSAWRPQVIIRTMVAHHEPMNPGVQHLGDYTEALYKLLDVVRVTDLITVSLIRGSYERAAAGGCHVIVERADLYD